MSGYHYEDLRPYVFTEAGSLLLMEVRDRVRRLIGKSGAVTMTHAIKDSLGDTWMMLACVDRLVAIGELREVGAEPAGQMRVFVPGPKWPREEES